MKNKLYRIILIGIQPNFTYSFTVWCTKEEVATKAQYQREYLQDRGMLTEEIYSYE